MFQSPSQEITNIVAGLEQAHAPCSRVYTCFKLTSNIYMHGTYICTCTIACTCAPIFYQALNSGRELVAATDALEELQSTPYV